MEKLTIRNLTELRKLSNIIAKLLRPDIYLILEGTLGAGKTELTKMIAKSLGISRNVNSPTFNILQRYHLEEREIFLNHFDFFRLKKDEDISFFKDYCLGNINIIE
jgi:tRNA threonylcarbamoyladenosine biosynthesis protein TsaE